MLKALSSLLIAQRQNGTSLATVPPEASPQTIEDAYVVQSEVAAAVGEIGGWKVTPVPTDGTEPLTSPWLKSDLHESGVHLARSALHGVAMEVEFAVTLGADLGADATVETVKAAIGSCHVALEVLASRYTDRSTVSKFENMADFQANGCVVLGPKVDFASVGALDAQQMVLSYDGKEAHRTEGNASTDNVLAALTWLAKHAAGRGTPLKAGQVVITGARIGAVPLEGSEVVAVAPGLGTVSATIA